MMITVSALPRNACLRHTHRQPASISQSTRRSYSFSPQCSAEAAQKPKPEVVKLPSSRLEAVQLAAKSILLQVPAAASKRNKKGFKKAAVTKRLAVEIPVADSGASETVGLSSELLSELQAQAGSFTAVFSNEDAASLAKQQLPGSLQLREACRCSKIPGNLLLVAPDASDVALVEQLLEEVWQGEVAVVLNSEWTTDPVPAKYQSLVDSFEITFSFLPVAIQGLLGSVTEGAVLRHVKTKDASQSTWQVLYCDKGEYVKVTTKPSRPTAKDLELVFYNLTAATSPMAQTVGKAATFFKGLMPKGKR